MKHILSLAAGTLPEFQPDQIAVAAGQAGFTHCGFTIDPDQWDATALSATKEAIARYGLSILDVEVVWIPEDGQLADHHKMIIDAGLELGAANVLVVSADPDKDRTAEAIHQLCDWAAPGNMRVALEFLMITAVRNMDDALDIIARADHAAAALLIDTIHFQRARHDVKDLENVDPLLLPYTQVCDGNLTCEDNFESYLTDAVDLRSMPGEGELPVSEILRGLPDAIPLSLEIRSKACRDQYPDPVERAKAIRSAGLAFFERSAIPIK